VKAVGVESQPDDLLDQPLSVLPLEMLPRTLFELGNDVLVDLPKDGLDRGHSVP